MTTLFQQGGWMLGVALVLGVVDWVAVARRSRQLEYVFKPATLVAVIVGAGLLTRGPHDARLALWFLPGLCFSLAGDVFLMLPGDRFFLPGLLSFFAAHVFYIIGLNPAWPPLPALAVLVVVGAAGAALYSRVSASLRAKGRREMLIPTGAYAAILSLMLFSAWATLFRPGWPAAGRLAIVVGATLFFASDSMLAWDRFVEKSRVLHVLVIVTYHLAQIALAAAIALS
jgi:uncharacterized membrane protein YhhN